MSAGCGAVKVARLQRHETLCDSPHPFSWASPYMDNRPANVLRRGHSAAQGHFANSLSCLKMTSWHMAGFYSHHTFAESDPMGSRLFALAALTALAIPTAASAQRVVADIRIQDGPVAGRIVVGHPGYARRWHDYSPRYHTVAVYRTHRHHEWFRRHGFRAVHVWYDSDRDRYYDDAGGMRGRLREVVVYERGGRYYREDWRDDDRRQRDHRGWREDD